MDQRYAKSVGWMGCALDHRSFSLERGPAPPDPRSGWHLRPNRNSANERHGYPRQAHLPASPWQNGYAERLIGSIRCKCSGYVIVLGEAHLRKILRAYADYYHGIRTHRSLNQDAPISRSIQRVGFIAARPILGGFASPLCSDLGFSAHTTSRWVAKRYRIG